MTDIAADMSEDGTIFGTKREKPSEGRTNDNGARYALVETIRSGQCPGKKGRSFSCQTEILAAVTRLSVRAEISFQKRVSAIVDNVDCGRFVSFSPRAFSLFFYFKRNIYMFTL